MSPEETFSLLLRSLAEKTGREAGELEAELGAAGPEYPFDSVWLVSAGAHAARKMGIKLKNVRQHAAAFKSVRALATYLSEVDQQRDAA